MITDQYIYNTVVERISKQDNYRLIQEAGWDPTGVFRYGNNVTPIGCFIPEEYYRPPYPNFGELQCRYLSREYQHIFKTAAFANMNCKFISEMNTEFAYISLPNEHNQILKFLHRIGIKNNLVVSEYIQNLMILI